MKDNLLKMEVEVLCRQFEARRFWLPICLRVNLSEKFIEKHGTEK